MLLRLFVGLYAVLFLGFGAFVLINPDSLNKMIGAVAISRDGIYELRSNYGGVSLGIGLFCLAATIQTTLARPALFVLFVYTGGYALGRILAWPSEGAPSNTLLAYAVFEAVTAALSLTLLLSAAHRR